MPSRRPAPRRAARTPRVSLRRLLAATLATYALALFRRHLLQALAHAGALLRAHPLPALVVLHHALLLLGRQAGRGSAGRCRARRADPRAEARATGDSAPARAAALPATCAATARDCAR